MKKEDEPPIVPDQQDGAQKDIIHSELALDENDARKLFMIARNRLVNVNHWHEYAAGLSATFRLTNALGQEVDRTAEKGDYFKISVPAPGPSSGDGYDWVQVEAVEDKSDPNGSDERMALRVRPAADPTQRGENVSHFFSNTSTSSFVVERQGGRVSAAVYGRNEVPNTETDNIIDKVRNAVVGVSALMGLANVQWKNLVSGLIKAK